MIAGGITCWPVELARMLWEETRMRQILSLPLVIVAIGFAPAPFPRSVRVGDPNRADLDQLQGTWQISRHVLDDAEMEPNGLKLIVEGSRLHWMQNGSRRSSWTFTLDARGTPKAMDMTREDGDSRWTVPASYALDGDTLTICSFPREKRKVRPADLKPDWGRELMVFRRVKR
jgi:uncharacterized protein (TIGR03067 family)